MLAIIYISSLFLNSVQSAGWSHDDFENWATDYPECGYNRQSPIDITIDDETSNCLSPLELQWTSELQHFAIRNTGHSLKAIPFEIDANGFGDMSGLEVLHHTNDTSIRLTNSFYNTFSSRIDEEYCFDSLHFHWGVDNEHGSEHTINGESYPLELHLVHYSCDWYMIGGALYDYARGEVEEKYDDDNVLAVIGVLFEIGDEPNAVLQQILNDVIIDGVSQFHDPIEKYGDHLLEIFYDEFDMNGLLPDNREMIAYEGSLTTPPCYETVRWHVMKETMSVTEEQMDQFRLLLTGTNTSDIIAPNFRPVQPLNGRNIYHCQEDVDAIAKEKEAIPDKTVEEGGDSNEISDREQMWFIIGVTFIALFGVSVIIIAYLGHIVYTFAHKEDKRHYVKTSSVAVDDEENDDIEINGNGTSHNGNGYQ